jgi:Putative Flp pilus-assembly TadE/G-like
MKTSSAAPPHRGPLRQLLARFRAHAKALAFDKRGGIAIWMALGMPVVFGFAGLGLDVSSWYMDRRIMQTAVDAAAVEAAHELMSGVTDKDKLEKAANKYDPDKQLKVSRVLSNPPAVEVVLTRQGMLTFSSLFVSDSGVTIQARAVGGIVPGKPICMLALDQDADEALYFSGTAKVDFNCGIASNSASNSAIYLNGNAKVEADSAQAYGYFPEYGGLTTSQPPQVYAPRLPDPYGPEGRNLQAPSASTCDYASISLNNENRTLYPGTYCDTLEIKNSTVTFAPGTYVIDNGNLNIQTNNADVFGKGVTFILAGTSPGIINLSANAKIELTAPSSGPYAGVLLFEDPKAPSHPGKHSANGGAGLKLNGAIYTPKRKIEFSGGSGTSGQCLQIIARQVSVTGNGTATTTIANNQNACDALGVEDMRQRRVRLIE